MINIQNNVSLKKYNSFKVDSVAKYFYELRDKNELLEIFQNYNKNFLVIGEGNNILFTRDLDYLVIKNSIKGIDIIEENEDYVIIKINSGENFSNIIRYFSNLNYSGIENLIDIPGNIGGAVVQNIGAYGCEIKDVILSVEVFDIKNNIFKTIVKNNLDFSYRSSIFKKNKSKYIITSTVIKLHKNVDTFKLEYKGIKEELKNNKINPATIASAISKIRNRKLPDPKLLANAGSFFKNPVISKNKFNKLKLMFQDMPSYAVDDKSIKIPAAWLIEKSGFKNYRYKNVGVYENHALILVNYSSTNGEDLKILSKIIKDKINKIFDIVLEEEVIMI